MKIKWATLTGNILLSYHIILYYMYIFRYQQYVGHVTWSSFEQVAGGRRKVLLATNEGVIAAINAGPGTIGNCL